MKEFKNITKEEMEQLKSVDIIENDCKNLRLDYSTSEGINIGEKEFRDILSNIINDSYNKRIFIYIAKGVTKFREKVYINSYRIDNDEENNKKIEEMINNLWKIELEEVYELADKLLKYKESDNFVVTDDFVFSIIKYNRVLFVDEKARLWEVIVNNINNNDIIVTNDYSFLGKLNLCGINDLTIRNIEFKLFKETSIYRCNIRNLCIEVNSSNSFHNCNIYKSMIKELKIKVTGGNEINIVTDINCEIDKIVIDLSEYCKNNEREYKFPIKMVTSSYAKGVKEVEVRINRDIEKMFNNYKKYCQLDIKGAVKLGSEYMKIMKINVVE